MAAQQSCYASWRVGIVPGLVPLALGLRRAATGHGFILDALPFFLAAVYVLLVPFAKVEESFHLQATHDFLIHGTDLAAYDHHEFPGIVPRTFIGAAYLATLSLPARLLVAVAGLPKIFLQVGVRITLAALVCSAVARYVSAVSLALGRSTGVGLVLALAATPHFLFYASRTLPNIFAVYLVAHACEHWVHLAPLQRGPQAVAAAAQQRGGGGWWITTALPWLVSRCVWAPISYHLSAAITYFVLAFLWFRCDMLLLLASSSLSWLIAGRATMAQLIAVGSAVGLLALTVSVSFDSIMWRRWLWPEGEVLFFNAIENRSHEYGVSPAHWYLTSALPRAFCATLAFLPLGLLTLTPPPPEARTSGTLRALCSRIRVDARICELSLPALLFIALYSILPHKEVRFLFPAFPLLYTAIGSGLAKVSITALALWRNTPVEFEVPIELGLFSAAEPSTPGGAVGLGGVTRGGFVPSAAPLRNRPSPSPPRRAASGASAEGGGSPWVGGAARDRTVSRSRTRSSGRKGGSGAEGVAVPTKAKRGKGNTGSAEAVPPPAVVAQGGVVRQRRGRGSSDAAAAIAVPAPAAIEVVLPPLRRSSSAGNLGEWPDLPCFKDTLPCDGSTPGSRKASSASRPAPPLLHRSVAILLILAGALALIISSVATGVYIAAAMANYPGGSALQRLYTIYARDLRRAANSGRRDASLVQWTKGAAAGGALPPCPEGDATASYVVVEWLRQCISNGCPAELPWAPALAPPRKGSSADTARPCVSLAVGHSALAPIRVHICVEAAEAGVSRFGEPWSAPRGWVLSKAENLTRPEDFASFDVLITATPKLHEERFQVVGQEGVPGYVRVDWRRGRIITAPKLFILKRNFEREVAPATTTS